MPDTSQILGTIGAVGGLSAFGKIFLFDRPNLKDTRVGGLEDKLLTYQKQLDDQRDRHRQEIDEVRSRLNECRDREASQKSEMARLQGQVEGYDRRVTRLEEDIEYWKREARS